MENVIKITIEFSKTKLAFIERIIPFISQNTSIVKTRKKKKLLSEPLHLQLWNTVELFTKN